MHQWIVTQLTFPPIFVRPHQPKDSVRLPARIRRCLQQPEQQVWSRPTVQEVWTRPLKRWSQPRVAVTWGLQWVALTTGWPRQQLQSNQSNLQLPNLQEIQVRQVHILGQIATIRQSSAFDVILRISLMLELYGFPDLIVIFRLAKKPPRAYAKTLALTFV